jgi:hypothetical protein
MPANDSYGTTLANGAWNANDDEGDPRYFASLGYPESLTGDRADNYVIGDTAETEYEKEFFIHKKALTIKANDKAIVYGDSPANAGVSYSGLVNGTPNTKDVQDGKPGEYLVEPEESDNWTDVIDKIDKDVEAVKYVYNYAQNGKPGSYTITPDVSNLSSRNYKITAAKGTLTVKDKVSTLVAKGTKKGSRAVKISWNSVTGAASYDVYASRCSTPDKKYTPKYVATVKGNSYKLKKLNGKKLNKNTCYKYYVVAKNAAGVPIATSMTGHCITGNVRGKTVNAKSMTVNTASVSVGKGGTAKLSASYKKAKSGKKYKLNNNAHSALTRFTSENPAVATVDANGIVTGVGTGWTRVYVQGVTGMWQVVEVNVQ